MAQLYHRYMHECGQKRNWMIEATNLQPRITGSCEG